MPKKQTPIQYQPKTWNLLKELEMNFTLTVLRACDFNQVWAARFLGCSVRGLRYRIMGYRCLGYDIPLCASKGGKPRIESDVLAKLQAWVEFETHEDIRYALELPATFWNRWREWQRSQSRRW